MYKWNTSAQFKNEWFYLNIFKMQAKRKLKEIITVDLRCRQSIVTTELVEGRVALSARIKEWVIASWHQIEHWDKKRFSWAEERQAIIASNFAIYEAMSAWIKSDRLTTRGGRLRFGIEIVNPSISWSSALISGDFLQNSSCQFVKGRFNVSAIHCTSFEMLYLILHMLGDVSIWAYMVLLCNGKSLFRSHLTLIRFIGFVGHDDLLDILRS